MSAGQYTVRVSVRPAADPHLAWMQFTAYSGGTQVARGAWFPVVTDTPQTVAITTDPLKHNVIAMVNGLAHMTTNVTNEEPIRVDATNAASAHDPSGLLVSDARTPAPTLCQSLIH